MDKIINVRLMSEPANWVIVTAMAMICALTLDIVTREVTNNG